MTRLVICDLDGTLLPAGKKSLSSEVCTAIKRIVDKGIVFAVASGRPYDQLKELFGPLSSRIVFICLDGALAIYRDCVIYKNRLCKIEAARLVSLFERATVFGRMKSLCFDKANPEELIKQKINTLGSEVFKVALYGEPVKSSIARVCYNKNGICEYVDFHTNKGAAAKAVMKKFVIDEQDTVAIGDGDNDIELLRAVAKPYKIMPCDSALDDINAPQISDIVSFLREI